ncbi:MAG: hypothetical protein Q8Q41_03000 [bacterium]|nr:hypothetical protein [bacterium]
MFYFFAILRRPAAGVLISGLFIGFGIVAFAQTGATSAPADEGLGGITFPIAELGNCGSKDACRTYCNDSANIKACMAFAESHGLVNKKEAERAQKFAERLNRGGGPGGCTSPQACETFCGRPDNLEACIAFAEEHGLADEHVAEAKKVLQYVKAGGKFPGGCNSKESCGAYCGNSDHADECLDFFNRAGLTGPAGEGQGVEQFRKFTEMVKKGETPGGCNSKESCETFCREESNFKTCVAFAEKMGFMEKGQAQRMRQSGRKGPGGCNSEESCRAYCNDETHREECYRFAEEHGLINKEELRHAKEGLVRLRQGLDQAPPEVAACLKSTLGPDVIANIQAGNLVPGPEIGERVKSCFEKFGRRGDPREAFQKAPPEIVSCLKEKLGAEFDKVQSGTEPPTPEQGDAMRVCFQAARIQSGEFGKREDGPRGEGMRGGPHGEFQDFLRGAPPEIAACMQSKLGGDFEKFKSGESEPGREVGEKIKGCFKEFKPRQEQFEEGREGERRRMGETMPPAVRQCLQSKLGADFEKFLSGQTPPTENFRAQVQACSSSERPQDRPERQEQNTPRFPPAVLECLREAVSGEEVQKFLGGSQPSPAIQAHLNRCFETLRTNQQGEQLQVVPPQTTRPQGLPGQFQGRPEEFRGQFDEQQQLERQHLEEQRRQEEPQNSFPQGGPATTTPPPSSQRQGDSFLGLILQVFGPLLGR